MPRHTRPDQAPCPPWVAFVAGVIVMQATGHLLALALRPLADGSVIEASSWRIAAIEIPNGLIGTLTAMTLGLRHSGWLTLMVAAPYVLISLLLIVVGWGLLIPFGVILTAPIWFNQLLGMGFAVIVFKWRDHVRALEA